MMVRLAWLATGVVSWLVLLSGCTASGSSDPQFELRKLRTERDTLAQQLQQERARATVLQSRIDAEQTEWNAARARAAALTEELARVRQDYEKLQRLIEQRAERPVTRPAIPVSPLPAETDNALKALSDKYPDRIWYDRGRGAVSFANDRLFDPGSDVVRPEALPMLQALAAILAATPGDQFEIIVVGHTDDSPITRAETLARHPSNRHLSVHRAIAVEEVLARAGVPAGRMGVMGYGEYRPVSQDRARNRRVEVFLVRKGAVQAFDPVVPAR